MEILHRIDNRIESGIVIFNPKSFELTFSNMNDYRSWQEGCPMKLIVLWYREAIPPRYRY